jgi:hypothetical protein
MCKCAKQISNRRYPLCNLISDLHHLGCQGGYKGEDCCGLLHWDDYSTVTSFRENYFPEHPSLPLGPGVAVVRSFGRLGLGSASAVFAGEEIVTTASATTALETC